jgi:hypothetical protein
MVYGGTFLRNFKFYAKTLTKLHDLTVVISVTFIEARMWIRLLLTDPRASGRADSPRRTAWPSPTSPATWVSRSGNGKFARIDLLIFSAIFDMVIYVDLFVCQYYGVSVTVRLGYLDSSVADPGSGAFLNLDPDPGSGIGFFSGSRIPTPYFFRA